MEAERLQHGIPIIETVMNDLNALATSLQLKPLSV
jgi:LDH2 family malate/lactate/ureidoglycolate dehydrogenase